MELFDKMCCSIGNICKLIGLRAYEMLIPPRIPRRVFSNFMWQQPNWTILLLLRALPIDTVNVRLEESKICVWIQKKKERWTKMWRWLWRLKTNFFDAKKLVFFLSLSLLLGMTTLGRDDTKTSNGNDITTFNVSSCFMLFGNNCVVCDRNKRKF